MTDTTVGETVGVEVERTVVGGAVGCVSAIAADGIKLGGVIGTVEEGLIVGNTDGDKLGSLIGGLVGDLVGNAVITTLGVGDGVTVGSLEGFALSFAVV